MAKTKISQFDATAANNTDLNSISIAEGTAPSNINNAIRELMSQLADLNLGNEVLSTLKIDNLHLDGNTIVTLDTNGDLNLTPNGTGAVTIAKADINGGAIDGTPIGASSASTGAFSTLSASSTANLGSTVTISGGNIDGVIGANTPAAITGTVITANTNFAGNLTGNVTGTVDGVVGGTTPAAVTGTTITANTKFVGAIDGNVTATSGTSTFNNVTINGTLDMDSTTSQTITGLATPSGSTDAATKGYVDTEVSALVDSAPAALNTLNELAAALGDDASFSTTVTNSIAAKLPLAGGTMTGDIDANSNTVSGLKAPSASNDATTKTYVDTADALKLNLSGGTLSGNLAMGSNKVTGLDTPTASGDATTKGYVDGILGSATSAATSASAASTSATNAANSATASENSNIASAASAASAAASYDLFDDRFIGAKSAAPTVDNDGDALVTGALYFNTSSNQLFVWSGSAWTQAAFTASGFLSGSNNLSDVDNAGTARTNLGLAIGTNVQAFDADLSALAGLTSAADKGIQFTGSGTAGTYDLTSAGKALLDDADAAAQRTTLGLGSAATLTAGTSASNLVQLDGSAKLPAVDGSALTGISSDTGETFTASGAILDKSFVAITTDGNAKVEAVYNKRDASRLAPDENDWYSNASDPAKFSGDLSTSGKHVVYDPDTDRVILLHTNNSVDLVSQVGTVTSGTVGGEPNRVSSIAWGGEQDVETGYHGANGSCIAYDTTNNKIVAFFREEVTNTHRLTAKVGTVTGGATNTISWGSAISVGDDHAVQYVSAAFVTHRGKFLIAYQGENSYLKAVSFTVSGTGGSFGTIMDVTDAATTHIDVAYNSVLQQSAVAYSGTSNYGYIKGLIMAADGSLTGGNNNQQVTFSSATTKYINVTANPNTTNSPSNSNTTVKNDEYLLTYYGTNNYLYAIILTQRVDGEVSSQGATTLYSSGEVRGNSCSFDVSTGRFTVMFVKQHSSATLAGEEVELSSGTITQINNDLSPNSTTSSTTYVDTCYDPDTENTICVFTNTRSGVRKGGSFGIQGGKSNNHSNFIGVAANAASDGESVLVKSTGQVAELNANASSNSDMTVGNIVYLENDATSSDTQTDAAWISATVKATNSVDNALIGRVISSTKIMLGGNFTGAGHDDNTQVDD